MDDKALERQLKDLNKIANDVLAAITKAIDFKLEDPFENIQPVLDDIMNGEYEYGMCEQDDDTMTIFFDIAPDEDEVTSYVTFAAMKKKLYCLITGYDDKRSIGYSCDFGKTYKPEVYDGVVTFEKNKDNEFGGYYDIPVDVDAIKGVIKSLKTLMGNIKKL